jgi:hypothetical protein
METTDKKLPEIRVIQFQMATCQETGGAFTVTSDIPRSATSAEIAAELATLREAGFFEIAAANRRKLERSQIIRDTLSERLEAAKKKGDPVKGGKIKEAIEVAYTDVMQMEVECQADDAMLLKNAPTLEGN